MPCYRSLYVHVPFCQGGKCDYCAFYSLGQSTAEQRRRYLVRLQEEFSEHAAECEPLRSIFIGGGTPSALALPELAELLEAIRNSFPRQPDCEWTMEANPESLTAEKLSMAMELGVNRLSLGVQSFHPRLRCLLGRRGTLDTLPGLVTAAKSHGLKHLNFDLIYAIPGETPDEWETDLQRAVELSVDHLSCYSLIFEDGTPLSRRLAPPADDDALFLACWQANDELLGAAGFQRYEISNFARAGGACRHNWEVWHGQTYLGCGPAAVSFDGSDRPANPSDLEAWLAHAPAIHDRLPPDRRAREILAFGLRTTAGWTWDQLQNATGFSRADTTAMPAVPTLLAKEFLLVDDQGIRPTPKGLLFDDLILSEFL